MNAIREIALAKAIGGSGGGDISVESLSVTANGQFFCYIPYFACARSSQWDLL